MMKLLLILFIISYFQIRLEDVFSLTIFHLQWGLQDIFKTCLQDVFFKAFSRHFFNTSPSRRLQENVLQTRFEDILKPFGGGLGKQNTFTLKKSSPRQLLSVFLVKLLVSIVKCSDGVYDGACFYLHSQVVYFSKASGPFYNWLFPSP